MHKLLRIALLLAITALSPSAIAQDADDPYPWVNACKERNMALGADDDTAHGYCACIDHEMGDEEVNDIESWENANPDKASQCREAAGWK